MLHHRRVFQHFYSNRLRQHQFVSVYDHDTIHSHLIGWCYQIDRTKCDVVTHKNQIQHFDIADFIHRIPPNNARTTISTKKPLPFEALPCDDPPNTIVSRLTGMSSLIKQLITNNFDLHFHEEIERTHQRLGPIFRKTLPSQSLVFVKSPELLRDVFSYEGKYPKHFLPGAWLHYNEIHNIQRGLLFMDDAEWMEARRILSPLMLRNDHRFYPAIELATDKLLDDWKRYGKNGDEWSEVPDIITTLYDWSARTLLNIMFGKMAAQIFNDMHDQLDRFAHIVHSVFEDTVPLTVFPPQLARKLGLSIWKKFEQSSNESLSIANEITTFALNQPEHDGLLRELKELNVDNEMIKRLFTDLIMAGGDTMAVSTQFALMLLAQNPQWQVEMHHELMTTDKHDPPLIKGATREALRLYPVATFIVRILTKDAILSNHLVPKNTMVSISTYSAGRDESSFPNAHTFDPSRWNRDPVTGTLKGVNRAQSSIPYALGARNCIGQRIANAQLHCILSKLLRTFKVKILNPNEFDIVMRMTIVPNKPIRFAFKRID